MTIQKQALGDLALFGGDRVFSRPRSTSNLVRPDIDVFLSYSRIFYDAQRYSNTGPVSVMLEERLAEFHEANECVVFSCGFWGLVLTIRCLALPDCEEVLMPSLTYRRMADAVAWTGLIPRFCDVEASSLAPSADTMRPLISEATALILGAQPMVNCCDAPGLEALAEEVSIPLLIDSVESVYESYQGRRVGTFGQAELFSLHASKLVNGFEGGYITTEDRSLAEELRLLRGFGYRGQDEMIGLGLNAKLNEIHAAMTLAGLDEVDQRVEQNHERYQAYCEEFRDLPQLRLLQFDESERCGYKNIVFELRDDWPLSRKGTLSVLNAEGILSRAYYSPPLHMKNTSYPTYSRRLQVTERFADRLMLMPSGFQVSIEDIRDVMDVMRFISDNAGAIDTRLA
jgi:dTDP-4-amino-4,6-dideoxygalactose transaminase